MNVKNKPHISSLCSIGDRRLVIKNWYVEIFNTNFGMEYHEHPQIELMYCAKGAFELEYFTDALNRQWESIVVPANSFVLVNTGYYHKVTILADGTKILNLEIEMGESPFHAGENDNKLGCNYLFTFKELASVNEQLGRILNEPKLFWIFHDTQNVYLTLKELLDTVNHPVFSDSPFMIRLLATKLFVEISHCDSNEIKISTGISYIKKALTYMRQNMHRNPSVEMIAKNADVSPSHLQALFQKELKKSVHQTLNDIKIENAKYLLSTTSLNNSEIATLCGLVSREMLNYNFKKSLGCSPNQYRKQINQKQSRHFSHSGEKKLT